MVVDHLFDLLHEWYGGDHPDLPSQESTFGCRPGCHVHHHGVEFLFLLHLAQSLVRSIPIHTRRQNRTKFGASATGRGQSNDCDSQRRRF